MAARFVPERQVSLLSFERVSIFPRICRSCGAEMPIGMNCKKVSALSRRYQDGYYHQACPLVKAEEV